MTDIEKHFANNSDDWRIGDVQLLGRASVKRESRTCPAKDRVANLTSLRFCWYFADHNSRLVSGGILKRNVKITVRLTFRATTRPVRANHLFSISVRSEL
jgi:hypothetical protein